MILLLLARLALADDPTPAPDAPVDAASTEAAPATAAAEAPTAAALPPLPADVVQLDWRQVEVKVQARVRPDDYPKEARIAGAPDAYCVVRLQVDTQGVPYAVEVRECPPLFVEAARDIASRYRFYPHEVDGEKRKFAFDLKVSFKQAR